MSLENTNALCTVDDLADDLDVDPVALGSKLERRILAASAMIETYCARSFKRNLAKTERLAGGGGCRLLPSLLPINSVTGILFDGGEVDPASYSIDVNDRGEGWAIYSRSGWAWTVGGIVTMGGVQPIPGTEESPFSVTYSGGYALPNDPVQTEPILPAQLREAACQLGATLWRNKGRDQTVMAESDGDASVQRGYLGGVEQAPGIHMGIPGQIAGMIAPWRRVF